MAETNGSQQSSAPMAAHDAVSAAGDGVSKLKSEAATLASEVGDAAKKAAASGKNKAAEALDGVAKLADDAASKVDEHLGETYGNYARKASAAVSNVATALQGKDIDELVADTRAFVKKSPVVAIGAAAAVGFLLTRLIKVGTGGSDNA